MMHQIFIDVESIPLPLAQREFLRRNMTAPKMGNIVDPKKKEAKIAEAIREFEAGEGAGLDELQGQVAIIGYILNDEPYRAITLQDHTEKELLAAFWSCVVPLSTDCEIIGWNVKGFDGPFLIHRSWINGIQVPRFMVSDLREYNPRQWRDPMLLWQLGNRQADFRKLTSVCGAFGIEVKQGEITGANFAEWWERDKAACVAYNQADVEAVKAIWELIGQ